MTVSSTRQLRSDRAASRSAIISAWAVGSARTSRSLCPAPITSPSRDDDRADRHVVVLDARGRLAQRQAHEVLVAGEEVGVSVVAAATVREGNFRPSMMS